MGLLLVAMLLLGPCTLAASQAFTSTPRTVVSIEFDDGWENATQAASILASYDMTGTFFIISGLIGQPDYMTWSQLHTLANEGDEIAGHTIDHPMLTSLNTVEQEREICNDRVNLINQGFEPTDFAYPDGAYTPTTEAIAKACGYNSARTVAGVLKYGACTANAGPTQPPSPCVDAETIPPLDPYATRTPATVTSTDTPATIESLVTQAQNNGGGWVQIDFHQICDGVCPGASEPVYEDATPETLSAVLAWLQTQEPNGTVVEPVNQVIGGTFKPAVPGPPAPPPGTGPQLLQNSNLETNTTGANVPDCFEVGAYGTNTANFNWSENGPSGSNGETVAMTSYTSGDAEVYTTQDQGTCSPSATVGQVYSGGVWYESNVPITLELWYRNTFGFWQYWTSAGPSPPSTTYVQATFQTPPLPAGATALSLGLEILQVGSATAGDFSLGTAGSA
ncbi:MAG TPA: polysaccharide deacetylase family protein [Acidimicrobiales bacterium]|nr:polysaccharide deacetylase family protein [Acidimicrobiales bacterium]